MTTEETTQLLKELFIAHHTNSGTTVSEAEHEWGKYSKETRRTEREIAFDEGVWCQKQSAQRTNVPILNPYRALKTFGPLN